MRIFQHGSLLFGSVLGGVPLAGMVAVIGYAGWVLFGAAGAVIMLCGAAILSVLPNGVRDWTDRRPRNAPDRKPLSNTFADRLSVIASAAGLSHVPQLRWIGGAPNAYVGGSRSQPFVYVSESLHDLLSERLLLAVLAHEFAHIRAGDRWLLRAGERLGQFAFTACLIALAMGAFVFITDGDLIMPVWSYWLLAIAPAVMNALHQTAMRGREFAADREAGRLTGDPAALAQALARINFAVKGPDLRQNLEEFTGLRARGWWRTHPPIEQRIERLNRAAS